MLAHQVTDAAAKRDTAYADRPSVAEPDCEAVFGCR
jgi:hypothetical protein